MSDMSRSSASSFLAALALGPRLAPVAGLSAVFVDFVAFFFSTISAPSTITFLSSAGAFILVLAVVTGAAFGSIELLAVFLATLAGAFGARSFGGLVAGMEIP
ncbi:hypothetical protein [Rhodoferax lithotrophicus]|uniref:hypothetical protein n=1 Tax=Rhodoferax lithotrophicus TaxID=2798804 RepID=UPI001CC38731|nr:hypothetical protein [Rhodoferax sp. MIZ03]